MKWRYVLGVVAVVAVVVALACGSSPTGASQSGTLKVMVKDSPFSDAKAVLVTFTEVSAHASGGGWTTLPFAGGATSRTCDLKQLTGAQDVLGTGSLPAGHYTQIRLTVGSAALYFTNAAPAGACAATIAAPGGQSSPLEISSGQVILNREFDIANGNTATMVLDFDGDRSINQTGNGTYRMSPVISIVSVQ